MKYKIKDTGNDHTYRSPKTVFSRFKEGAKAVGASCAISAILYTSATGISYYKVSGGYPALGETMGTIQYANDVNAFPQPNTDKIKSANQDVNPQKMSPQKEKFVNECMQAGFPVGTAADVFEWIHNNAVTASLVIVALAIGNRWTADRRPLDMNVKVAETLEALNGYLKDDVLQQKIREKVVKEYRTELTSNSFKLTTLSDFLKENKTATKEVELLEKINQYTQEYVNDPKNLESNHTTSQNERIKVSTPEEVRLKLFIKTTLDEKVQIETANIENAVNLKLKEHLLKQAYNANPIKNVKQMNNAWGKKSFAENTRNIIQDEIHAKGYRNYDLKLEYVEKVPACLEGVLKSCNEGKMPFRENVESNIRGDFDKWWQSAETKTGEGAFKQLTAQAIHKLKPFFIYGAVLAGTYFIGGWIGDGLHKLDTKIPTKTEAKNELVNITPPSGIPTKTDLLNTPGSAQVIDGYMYRNINGVIYLETYEDPYPDELKTLKNTDPRFSSPDKKWDFHFSSIPGGEVSLTERKVYTYDIKHAPAKRKIDVENASGTTFNGNEVYLTVHTADRSAFANYPFEIGFEDGNITIGRHLGADPLIYGGYVEGDPYNVTMWIDVPLGKWGFVLKNENSGKTYSKEFMINKESPAFMEFEQKANEGNLIVGVGVKVDNKRVLTKNKDQPPK